MQHSLGLKGPDKLHMTARFDRFDRRAAPHILPSEVMYDSLFPMRYDQGSVGACGAFSTGAIYEAVLAKHFKQPITPISKRAFYTLTLVNYEAANAGQDAGVYLGDACSTITNIGHVDESKWPEEDSVGSDYFAIPDSSLISKHLNALRFIRVGGYTNVVDSASHLHDAINAALYAHGPLVYGGTWANDWFDVGRDGVLNPTPTQGPVGGHARVYLGYSDKRQARLCLNSWGTSWGANGLYWEPYNLATEYLPTDVYALVIPQ